MLSARSRKVPRRMKYKASSISMVPTVTPRDRCERNLTHSKNCAGSRSNSPALSMRLTSSQVCVLGFPDLGGQRAAHGAGVLAGGAQAGHDAGRVALVLDHEVHHVAGLDGAVFLGVGGQQLADATAGPASPPGPRRRTAAAARSGNSRPACGRCSRPARCSGTSRTDGRRFVTAWWFSLALQDWDCVAVLFAACVWATVAAVAAALASSSRTQVSLVPPPCDELTTSEPSLSATRVRPPGTICTVLPLST